MKFVKNNWQLICFFICALLFYPLVWERLLFGRLIYWGELTLFTPGLFSLLCISLLFFDLKSLLSFFSYRSAKFLVVLFGLLLVPAIIHALNTDNYYFLSSLYWMAVPLFCAANRRKMEKYLPYFMVFLGLITIIQSLQDLRFGTSLYGLPGNWNWNADLLAVTLPFIFLEFYKRGKISAYTGAALSGCGIVLFYLCESKAAYLSLFTACILLLVLYYWHKFPPTYWIRTGILLFSFIVVAFVLLRTHIFAALADDQRIYLWQGAIELVKQNLWFGCGADLFESSYAPHIPADYYFGKLVSIRHTHSHNHFLQFAATMGIPALIAWISIILYAAIKNLPKAVGKGSRVIKLYFFVFIFLLLHSMLDIVDLSWPLGIIFLMTLGILLGRAVEDSDCRGFDCPKSILMLSNIFAACLTIILISYLYLNLFSSMHYRNAKLVLEKKDKISAFAEVKKSIDYKVTPENTYLAAKIALYDFKDPRKCLRYLEQLDALGFENYENSNLLKAKALAVIGKLSESLLYFAQEQDNFPLSCVNLYYYQLVMRKLGMKEQADAVSRHLDGLLKLKGFDGTSLPALLKDPDIDFKFRQFGKNIGNADSSK